MLRSVNLLQQVLTDVDSVLLRDAIRCLAKSHIDQPHTISASSPSSASSPILSSVSISENPSFLHPLVSIAVNRISDIQLSATAAESLAILLSCSALEPGLDPQVPDLICHEATIQTKRLIAMFITEIVLTSSPRALTSLSRLLRRDVARKAFCEKDGLSTLASTLQTHPDNSHTAIGEIVANKPFAADPVSASYHAVFAVWMLSFASDPSVIQLILQNVCSSRLVVVLARLLNHASGQRLKIARVTLASLRNLATGHTALHQRVRRDLIAASVPAILERLLRMTASAGSLIGNDDDAMDDAQALNALLIKEIKFMSTIDSYISEVQAGALHWSPLHKDDSFWMKNAQSIVDNHRGILNMLSNVILDEKSTIEEKVVACNDLAFIMRETVNGRCIALSAEGLKKGLMMLMTTALDTELRCGALTCVQLLMLTRRRDSMYNN